MTLFTAKKNRTNGRAPEGEGPSPVKKKLSRADRKQIEAAISRASRTDQKGISAQDSIPYERMWPDGICRVTGCYYTKTIQFQDINYQLSQNEDKTAIFEGWCDFRGRRTTLILDVLHRTGFTQLGALPLRR